MTPDAKQFDATGAVDTILVQIKHNCDEQGVPFIFALSRRRLGRVYGTKRKMVAAVALLDIRDYEAMHSSVLSMAMHGRAQWEACLGAGLLPPVDLSEGEGEEE